MLQFNDFINEKYDIDEAALIVSGKKAYPKFDNILVMSGGAGSGKGFVLKNVLAFQGKVFDVDALKTQVIKQSVRDEMNALNQEFKREYGKSLKDINLKDPEDTSNLHMFIKEKGLSDKQKNIFFKQAAKTTHKPNVIFDITMKDTKALEEVSEYAEQGGYDKKNIHIVWVLNNVTTARAQNAKRARSVSDNILLSTHAGASRTMRQLIQDTDMYRKYADGDVWIVFNMAGVDSTVVRKDVPKGSSYKPMYVEKYTALHIKEAGKPARKISEIDKALLDKIKSYVPNSAIWN